MRPWARLLYFTDPPSADCRSTKRLLGWLPEAFFLLASLVSPQTKRFHPCWSVRRGAGAKSSAWGGARRRRGGFSKRLSSAKRHTRARPETAAWATPLPGPGAEGTGEPLRTGWSLAHASGRRPGRQGNAAVPTWPRGLPSTGRKHSPGPCPAPNPTGVVALPRVCRRRVGRDRADARGNPFPG
jgi:hypothetical protein